MKKKRVKKHINILSEEERQLFLEAVNGPLEPEKSEALPPTSNKKNNSLKESDSELFLRAFASGFTDWTPTDEFMSTAYPKSRFHKKKAVIDASIDLHGLSREAAHMRLKVFIERCLFLHKRRILIIHGKGSGILRQEVRRFLSENDQVTLISDAPPRLGGDGAVVVELKKAK